MLALTPAAPAQAAGGGVKALLGPGDAVLVADPGGRVLLSENADRLLVPASTLKLLTSLVAFHYLGADYRFATGVYADDDGNLKVKGFGDPLLTSESFQEMARALASGPDPPVRAVRDLVMDPSYFRPSIAVPGRGASTEPYDAPIGALCANFNTVAFQRDAGGGYASAEEQTPLLPAALPRIKASGLKSGRITLSHRGDENTRYAGELFRHFLGLEGLEAAGEVRMGKVEPQKDREVYRYVSPFTLDQVAAQLLEFSNNFIANQVLVAAGAAAYGPPGTLDKGVEAAKAFSRKVLGMDLQLVEGSGLSRDNRVSARQMARVLEAFAPHRGLLRSQEGEFYKTGSLNGIRTRAGYLQGPGGGWYRFVVLCNTPGKGTGKIMERVKAFVAER